ncbi:MAG: hypothetical protein ABSC92_09985 [Rhizomicrobium sp.]|jgi:hypothetical protein
MIQAQNVRQTARHLRELARDSDLPDYVERLTKAADELEMRAAELTLHPQESSPLLTF